MAASQVLEEALILSRIFSVLNQVISKIILVLDDEFPFCPLLLTLFFVDAVKKG
jgi:hypothetical protein